MTNRSKKVYLCGYLFQDFAKAVFPDYISLKLTASTVANSNPSDLLLWSGSCQLVSQFKGTIVYLDGEAGKMPKIPSILRTRQTRVFYLGVREPPQKVDGHMELFHVAHTTLVRDYSANDLVMLHRQRGSSPVAPHFLLYVNSHCVQFREQAFNELVAAAALQQIELPIAKGRCHGMYPETRRFVNDRGERLKNADKLKGFRFVLAMENTFKDGYITEKIMDAFFAGAVPVYYGTYDVFSIFNRNAFIYYDIKNPVRAISKILELEKNKSAYEDMLKQPILAEHESSLETFFSLRDDIGSGSLRHKIRQLVGIDATREVGF